MTLASRYSAGSVEEKWYQHWMEKGYFKSVPDDREPYTIIIAPPNVTGVLHMGHILNNTVNDVMIRLARMQGKNACWVPGTDHASIATEAKVVRWLREEKGITKGDITRDQFVDYAWQWTEKYGGIILSQLKKLGASCDWDRTAFTMDEHRYPMVIQTFIDQYQKGNLYRGNRMVNWDPEAMTVLSNEEVIYHNENTQLVYVKYPLVNDPENSITVATTRAETILGDTAIAVHPDDERYKSWVGKMVHVPIINREIPVIADDYVDQEFGTGALKITPAHDPNDYEVGLRHNLEIIDVLNNNGTMSKTAGMLIGDDRNVARKKLTKLLDEEGFIEKIEDYTHNVGRSERTGAVIEPRLSLQWYVNMKELAAPALEAVMTDEVKFLPENMKNTYRHWMENIRDWCISRQLWWGHRIPAYYLKEPGEEQKALVFVATTIEEALEQAKEKTGNNQLTIADLRQDDDVLDTWFSSWLWPFSVFEKEEDLQYYYPTQLVVTGWDIIFLWIARMIIAGYEYKQERPFDAVYFTGMVRDKQRRKMSKSLGNSPDALKLIQEFGADGVRFAILSCSPAGGDLLFDEKLCEQGRNFSNKIWNACRLVKGWEWDEMKEASPGDLTAINWFKNKTHQMIGQIAKNFEQYRLSDILMGLYSFIWNDYCSQYLEMVKPLKGEKIAKRTYEDTVHLFEVLMRILHPFMPFITEEIWSQLKERPDGEDCIIQKYPSYSEFEQQTIDDTEYVKNLVARIRDERNKHGLKMRDSIELFTPSSEVSKALASDPGRKEILLKMANLSGLTIVASRPESSVSFISGAEKYYLVVEDSKSPEERRAELQKELDYARGFVAQVEKKLSNERFVQNAPDAVVAKERKKMQDGLSRVKNLEEALATLG